MLDGPETLYEGQVFNVSAGEDVRIRDLAALCIEFAGRGKMIDGPARVGEEGPMPLDYSLARRTFGYRPAIGFTDGFRKTAVWVAQQSGEAVPA